MLCNSSIVNFSKSLDSCIEHIWHNKNLRSLISSFFLHNHKLSKVLTYLFTLAHMKNFKLSSRCQQLRSLQFCHALLLLLHRILHVFRALLIKDCFHDGFIYDLKTIILYKPSIIFHYAFSWFLFICHCGNLCPHQMLIFLWFAKTLHKHGCSDHRTLALQAEQNGYFDCHPFFILW